MKLSEYKVNDEVEVCSNGVSGKRCDGFVSEVGQDYVMVHFPLLPLSNIPYCVENPTIIRLRDQGQGNERA